MKQTLFIFTTLLSLLTIQAQEVREDDLGDVSDAFQTAFFEAIKQKGIENYDKAIDLLIDCKSQAPDNASVHFELGKNYFELDKYQLAEKALLKADALKPNDRWILETLYNLYRYQKNSDKTIAILQKLNSINNRYTKELITSYYRSNQHQLAIDLIDQLDKKHGINKERLQLRHQIYAHGGNYKAQANYIEANINTATETDYVKLILAYSLLKNTSKSFKTAQLFAKAYPDSDTPYLSLYKFYMSKSNTDEAIVAMQKVLQSGTINDTEKYKVANDFFEFTKKNTEYLSELEKAVQLYPHQTIIGKMALLYKDANHQKAAAYLAVATKNKSNSFEDLKLIGSLLLKEYKSEESLKNSSKALELYPAQPIFYLQQAKAYNQTNQAKKALESLTFGLDYLIDNTAMEMEFYTEIAKAYRLLNDVENQQKYLQKAKKLNG